MKQTLFILALLTATIQTFAQSPRIKLNQITKDSLPGSVLISSPTDSGMVYSRDLYISYGADTVLILGGDTLAATSSIISSVLSDGVTITGDGTIGSELTADTSVLATLRALSDSLVNYVSTTELSDSTSNIRTDIPLIISDSLLVYVSRAELSDSLALVISSVTADGVTITGDGTVGSPLTVDTVTVISSVGRLLDSLNNVRTDLDLKQDQLNGTGFVKATGTTISYDNSTYLTSEVDGSVTNEIQTLSYNSGTNEITLSDGGGTEDLSNLDLVDSTRINATGDTAYYYQNGVLIGTGPIAGGGGGTTYNNISETADTVYISDYLDVDTSTLYVDATNNRVGIGTTSPTRKLTIVGESPGDYTNLPFLAMKAFGGTSLRFYGNYMISDRANGTEASPTAADSLDYIAQYTFGALSDNGNYYYYGSITAEVQGTPSGTNVPVGFDFYTGTTSSLVTLGLKADGGIEAPRLLNASTGNTMYYNTITDEISYSSSSIRFKDEIEDLPIGLNDLLKLKPSRYTYLPDGLKDYGYIAEQVYDIGLTEFVTFNENGQIEGLKDKYFMVLHTKAIQEQQVIIDQQATEIETLKSQIQLILNEIEQLKNN